MFWRRSAAETLVKCTRSICSTSRPAMMMANHRVLAPAAVVSPWIRQSVTQHAFRFSTESKTEEPKSEREEPKSEQHSHSEQSHSLETRILDCALKHVSSLGWTKECLRAGAIELGLSPASIGLIQNGEFSLVSHFIAKSDDDFVTFLNNNRDKITSLPSTVDQLEFILQQRLNLIVPVLSSWPQALAVQAQNPGQALYQRLKLADECWHHLGHIEVNDPLTWYGKRGALCAVYAQTELAMVTDFSPDRQETSKFLRRRLEQMVEMGKGVKEAAGWGETALAGLLARIDPNRRS